jgi:hypothetical protein
VRCSDGEDEFGEGCGDLVVRVEVDGQFVVTASATVPGDVLRPGLGLYLGVPSVTTVDPSR